MVDEGGAGAAAGPSVCLGGGALAARAATAAPSSPDALDDVLGRVGSDRASFGLSEDALATSLLDARDAHILRGARDGLRRPLDLPAYGRATAAALDQALTSEHPVTRAILAASALRDDGGIDACLDAAALAVPEEAPLATALAELRGKRELDRDEVAGVPSDLQRALVPVLQAAGAAAREIEAARAAVPGSQQEALATIGSFVLGIRSFEWDDAFARALGDVDVRRISAAAASVAFAVERADLARFAGASLPPIDLPTPLGPVVLRGAESDTWTSAGEAPLLLLDTGGDDRYRGAVAAATLLRPVSVLVDLGGDDTYGYPGDEGDDDGAGRLEGRTRSRVGRQGSGVLGAGLSFDLGGGDDRYRSLAGSQGSGSHGVGVLFDDGGDDRYEAEGFSQGAAAWGIGLLLDREGDDEHVLFTSGQGFGFSEGVGALVDLDGADSYVADPGDPSLGGTLRYPSQQLERANFSWSQGCGVGQRPDGPIVGRPLPGGIGVLRDGGGRDRYRAGVFAQGCGFVQGLGMLLDATGDDAYDGLYYVQGAAAHMGAALLLDGSGDDAYDATFRVQGPALAFAHDLSTAVVVDEAGDDTYRVSTLALGVAYANGASVFADAGGADRFTAGSDACFGASFTTDVRASRRGLPTTAVFVKAGGGSSYASPSSAPRPGSSWRSRGAAASPVERGAAVDAPSAVVRL